MHEWILYDYYMRENETQEVISLICSILNINPKHKESIFKTK